MAASAERLVAQPDEQMFERNIAHMASERREVVVTLDTEPVLEHVGFIAGLDEQWLELCISRSTDKVLLQRDAIVSVSGTRRRLSTLPPGPESDRIRRRVEIFSALCEDRLGRSR